MKHKRRRFIFPLSHLSPFSKILIALAPLILVALLKPWFPPFLLKAPIVLLYPLFLISTWLCGGIAGLITLFLSIVLNFTYIRPELFSELSSNPQVAVRFTVFFVNTLLFQILVTVLERSLRKSEAAVKERDDFLSTVSHELRTPITAIRLQLEMIKDRYKNAEVPLNALNPIEKMTNRQDKLVSSLLDLAVIESGQLSVRKEKIELDKLILKASTAAQDSMEAAEVKFDLSSVSLNCDRNKIEQAIFNIVQNAIKYGDKKIVNVSMDSSGSQVVIKVRNTGVEIAPSNVERIFEKLKRPLIQRQVQGVGVGLFLANHFVELHDGKIEVMSHKDAGTTFTVSLPLV